MRVTTHPGRGARGSRENHLAPLRSARSATRGAPFNEPYASCDREHMDCAPVARTPTVAVVFRNEMNTTHVRDLFFEAIAERRFAASIVGVDRVDEAVRDLERAHDENLIDSEVWSHRLAALRELLPDGFAARSLVVIAIPSSEVRVTFQRGRSVELTMPPTYTEYVSLPTRIAEWAGALLEPHGCAVRPAGQIPLKTLAVRSGLGDYGRNNICYVPGMGSWAHLVALYTDLEPEGEVWREPTMLERCASCRACIRVCPGEAISMERFLIRVERCITWHTELPAAVALPDWGPKRPPCVFGCMECQTKCPVNKAVPLRAETGPEFDEHETARLLAGAPLDDLSEATVQKLRWLDWIEPYDQLRRNLEGLLRES